MTYLVLDTETGGINPAEVSLLTGYLAAVDEDTLQVIEGLEFKLKLPVYHVTAEALRINNIDLRQLEAEGESVEKVTNKINQFLKKHATTKSVGLFDVNNVSPPDLYEPMTPVGHNVHFDVQGIKMRLPGLKWDKFVSYRVLDTQVIARFLQKVGKLPADLKCSLRSLAKYFLIKDEKAHDAKGDVDVNIAVLARLLVLGAA